MTTSRDVTQEGVVRTKLGIHVFITFPRHAKQTLIGHFISDFVFYSREVEVYINKNNFSLSIMLTVCHSWYSFIHVYEICP